MRPFIDTLCRVGEHHCPDCCLRFRRIIRRDNPNLERVRQLGLAPPPRGRRLLLAYGFNVGCCVFIPDAGRRDAYVTLGASRSSSNRPYWRSAYPSARRCAFGPEKIATSHPPSSSNHSIRHSSLPCRSMKTLARSIRTKGGMLSGATYSRTFPSDLCSVLEGRANGRKRR
jgi:hypothetical protein